MITVFKDVHSLNALFLTSLTVLGKTTLTSPLPLNAPFPTIVRLDGNTIPLNNLQLPNAHSPISITVSGIFTLSI